MNALQGLVYPDGRTLIRAARTAVGNLDDIKSCESSGDNP